MGAADRFTDRPLSTALEDRFGKFDFLQLVRVHLRPRTPGGVPLLPDEALRFRADLSAGFPGRNASALAWLPAREPRGVAYRAAVAAGLAPLPQPLLQVTTPDFCVGSVLGPLPEAFLEWMRDLDRAGHSGMRAFLDLFNHRLNVLRYNVRAQFEPGLNNDLPARTLQAQWLASIMGVGSTDAASQIPLAPRHWLGIGELLANARHSAAGVVHVLRAHLGCPVRLVPLVAAWRPIEPGDQQPLGNGRLGQDTLLGRSVWDVQASVRIEAGPLPFDRVQALLPALPLPGDGGAGAGAGAGFNALAALVRLMLDRRQDAVLDIQVPEPTVPQSHLVSAPVPGGFAGLRLGQTAWLKARMKRGARGRHRVVRLQVPAFDGEAA